MKLTPRLVNQFTIFSFAFLAVAVGVRVIAGPTNEPARVIANHSEPPDSLVILRDGEVQVWAGGPWTGKADPEVRGATAFRSFTKFGPAIMAWNIDKEGAFFIAWEDPESFELEPGDYQFDVIFWSPEPDTVDAGIYTVGRGRRMN